MFKANKNNLCTTFTQLLTLMKPACYTDHSLSNLNMPFFFFVCGMCQCDTDNLKICEKINSSENQKIKTIILSQSSNFYRLFFSHEIYPELCQTHGPYTTPDRVKRKTKTQEIRWQFQVSKN